MSKRIPQRWALALKRVTHVSSSQQMCAMPWSVKWFPQMIPPGPTSKLHVAGMLSAPGGSSSSRCPHLAGIAT